MKIIALISLYFLISGCASTDGKPPMENTKLSSNALILTLSNAYPLSDWEYGNRTLYSPEIEVIEDDPAIVKIKSKGLFVNDDGRRYKYTMRFAGNVNYVPDLDKVFLADTHNFQWDLDDLPTSYHAQIVTHDRVLIMSNLGRNGYLDPVAPARNIEKAGAEHKIERHRAKREGF